MFKVWCGFMLQKLNKVSNALTWHFKTLIAPKSLDVDSARREFILNILLVGSLFLAFMATLSALIGEIAGHSPRGSTLSVFVILLFFLLGYFASRRGKAKLVSKIL